MTQLERIRAEKDIIERRMQEWAEMMEEEYSKIVAMKNSLTAMSTLTAQQAAAIIGISKGTFYNAKSELIDKGYFRDGLNYEDVHQVAVQYKKHRSLSQVPNKSELADKGYYHTNIK